MAIGLWEEPLVSATIGSKVAGGMPIFTLPSIVIHDWRTRKSWTMSAKTLPQDSGDEPMRSLPVSESW